MSNKKYLKKILFLSAFLIITRSIYTEDNIENQILLKEISTDNDAQIDLDKPYEEQDLVTPGRISLKNNGGYIYSIVDPIPREPKLSIRANKKQNIDSERVEFFMYTNYQEIIKKWEILVYDEEDIHKLDPVGKLEGTEISLNKPIILNYSKEKIKEGDKYFYTLKVYDKEGRFDQTDVYPIEFVAPINASKNIDIANSIYGNDGAVIRNIQLKGSKVRVYGKDLQGVQKLAVNNQQVNLDYKGDFAYEYYTDMIGDLNLPVLMMDEEGNEYSYGMDVYLPSNYTFAVGIADLFIGKNYVSGSNAILQDNYKYDDNIFSSGRLAFYYKRVWEDYRLTAQADTWEQETKYLFKGFSKRRPRDLFEKLERDDIEFNLGDESAYYRDTDTSGKFYIKLEKQKSSILWGSFDTG
ncbi:MAG: hypothetical protein RR523_11305, partial [Cetobacterium sp.]